LENNPDETITLYLEFNAEGNLYQPAEEEVHEEEKRCSWWRRFFGLG